MRNRVWLAAAMLLVALLAVGCGAGGSTANSAQSMPDTPQPVMTSTAVPPTRPPAPTRTPKPQLSDTDKRKIFTVLFANCPRTTVETAELWFHRMSVAHIEGSEAELSGSAEGKTIGWEFTPTDKVVGGGWRVTYKWVVDNGVTQPTPVEATFLYSPTTNKIIAVDTWAKFFVENCY